MKGEGCLQPQDRNGKKALPIGCKINPNIGMGRVDGKATGEEPLN